MKHFLITAIVTLLVSTIAPAADTLIDTYSTWNGARSLGTSLGESGSTLVSIATYGQTFRAPLDSPVLERFSIWLSDSSAFDPDPLRFGLYVMEWTGSRATGPVLYQSGPMSTGIMPHDSWGEFRFDEIRLQLQPDQPYVFIVSASEYFDGVGSSALVGSMTSIDAYPGETLVRMNNGQDISLWTSQDWEINTLSWDIVFQAQFTAVPEPSSLSLLLLAATALCMVIRKRCC